MIRRLAAGFTALMGVLAVSLSWAPSAQAYDPNVKPQPWAYEKGLIPPENLTLRDGLVGHWVMWEGSGAPKDISGQRNHSSFSGGTQNPSWVNSIRGRALDFDGSDDIVTISHNGAIDDLDTISIAAWINPRSDGENNAGRIVDKAPTNNDFIFFFGVGLDIIWQARRWDGTEGRWVTDSSVPTNSFTHVVLTYDYSSTTNDPVFYFDGIPVSFTETATPTGNVVSEPGDAFIGNNDGFGRTFDGIIASVRIYDRVLTPAEVRQLATAPFADVWPEYAQQPTDGFAEEVAAPQIIIISWGTGLTLLALLAYMRRRKDYERSGFWG